VNEYTLFQVHSGLSTGLFCWSTDYTDCTDYEEGQEFRDKQASGLLTGLHDCFGATRLEMTYLDSVLHESWQDFLIFVRGEGFINDDDG
jgi:hypothetical protein